MPQRIIKLGIVVVYDNKIMPVKVIITPGMMTNVWPFASYSFPENGRVTAIASALHKKKRLISAMPTSVANRVIKLPIPPYINVIHNINNEGSKALRSINPSRKVLDDCCGGCFDFWI